MWLLQTHVFLVQASPISPRSSLLSLPFLFCVHPRPSARLIVGPAAVVLLPGTWAASMVGLSLDLSTPDPAPSCVVRRALLEHSCWERNCCFLLTRGCQMGKCDLVRTPPPSVHANNVCHCWTCPPCVKVIMGSDINHASAMCLLTMSSTIRAVPCCQHADNGAPIVHLHSILCVLTTVIRITLQALWALCI